MTNIMSAWLQDTPENRQLWGTLVVALLIIMVTVQFSPLSRAVIGWISRLRLNRSLSTKRSNDEKAGTVTGLFIHPVKSLRAVPVADVVLDTKGLVDDRRFMTVTPAPLPPWGSFGSNDATHRFLTQRQCPYLATVVVSLDNDRMTMSSYLLPKQSVVVSTTPRSDAPICRATLWNSIVTVQDMGDAAAAFLLKVIKLDKHVPDELKSSVRLVMQTPDCTRQTDEEYTPASTRNWKGQNPPVALCDGFPILIACQASLDELNRRLTEKGKKTLPMSRFRPNIVIEDTKPFDEDTWKVISIDGVILHVVKGCPRCKQSCTDQMTGQVTDEPLATLADFRARMPENTENLYFGTNVILAPGSVGRSIAVGASVQVLERGEPVWGD